LGIREDRFTSWENFLWLWVAGSSAEEHAVLYSTLQRPASVSAVRLLQLAQLRATNGTAGILELTRSNYLALGNSVQPGWGGGRVQDADPALWNDVAGLFGNWDADYLRIFLTPGNVTNETGSYRGMGALVVGRDSEGWQAPLTGDFTPLHGGIGSPQPSFTPTTASSRLAYSLLWSSTGEPAYQYNDPNADPATGISTFDAWSVQNLTPSSDSVLAPGVAASGSQASSLFGQNDASLSLKTAQDTGNPGPPSWWQSSWTTASDPVNVISGEFYIDTPDLTLPGPMPLQLRRNYQSKNLSDQNALGYGWKISAVPYLTVVATTNNATLVYEVEKDGSVIAFRNVAGGLFTPNTGDNPMLNNRSVHGIGSTANWFNASIQRSTNSGITYYTLHAPDGSVRSYRVRSDFAVTNGNSVLNRTRPYLDTWQDHAGNTLTFTFGTNVLSDDYGQVNRIQSSNGDFLGFNYDQDGRIIEAFTGDGRRVSYEYDQFGDLILVTLPDQSHITYDYQHLTYTSTNGSAGTTNLDSNHLLVMEHKPDGRLLQNVYDSQRRVVNQLATVGPDMNLYTNATFTYSNHLDDTNNTLASTTTGQTLVKDVFGHTNSYQYGVSLITNMSDALNFSFRQDWWPTNTVAQGFPRSLQRTIDKRGLVTNFQYDDRGNLTNTFVYATNLVGAPPPDLTGDGTTSLTNTTTYNTNNLPLVTIDAVGNQVQNIYSTNDPFLPSQIIRYAGSTPVATNFLFYHNVTNIVNDGVHSFTNQAFGLVQRVVRASTATNEWTHDGRGFITSQIQYPSTAEFASTDPPLTNYFFHNERGETVLATNALGWRTVQGFDPAGRPEWRELYDQFGQALFRQYTYYNANGEVTWVDGPRSNPQDYLWRDYDGAGRPITEIHWHSRARADGTGVEAETGDDLFATTFNFFDQFGNLTKATDQRGNYSLRYYDSQNQLVRDEFYDSSNALLATNGLAYNAAGDVTNAFNALGGSVQKQYTSTGKLKFQRNADGSTNAWTYYRDGRLRREYQRNGAYWETTYDDVNRKATRVFHSASGATLATTSTETDRRGNVFRSIDAGGFAFTNLFDGLDRVKIAAGPPIVTVYLSWDFTHYVTNTVQQVVTTFFDAFGLATTNVNALGEKTISLSDALGRPTRTEVRNAANVLVRESSTAYSSDHNSVTVTNGSGGGAVVSTVFSDNDGHPVLSIGYPSVGAQEYTRRAYDRAGNLVYEERDSSANGLVTVWSGAAYNYDGLNQMIAKSERDYAVTYFNRDTAGDVTNRVMPGGLKWQAIYNNAGQKLQDWNLDGGTTGTRTNTQTYFSAGSPFAGLPQTSTDGRGVTCTHNYDDWLRPVTNIYTGPLPEHNLTAIALFDLRGFPAFFSEQFTNPASGPAAWAQRSNDANGLLFSETISAGGNYYVSASDNWDSAGRRTGLGLSAQLSTFNYSYGWRADGLLASILGPTGGDNYSYTTAGMLTSRSVGSRYTSYDSRDGVGRPLSVTNTMFGFMSALGETLTWTGDGLLNTHTLARDFTDSRSYAYAPLSRRLATEALNLDATHRWTNSFTFDNAVPSGPGVLTLIQESTSPSIQQSTNRWSGSVDNFSRISTETNTISHRAAYGRLNGPATVTISVDGHSVPAVLNYTTSHDWTNRWSAMLELTPGAHQLIASAVHPSGLFTTNATIWITNNAANETVADTFDGAGYITQRIWKSPSGATNRTQTLIWSACGRLLKVSERDSASNGQDWTCVYDPLGRRLQTTQIIVTNGVALTNQPIVVSHYFDPMVEFLELGQTENGRTTWKLMGPDMDGRYGGQNGTGGFEAIVPGPDLFCPVVSDSFGNVLAVYDGSHGGLVWSASRPTGYGAVPGYRPITPGSSGSNILSLVMETAWRDRITESMGLVWLGANWYDPISGQFLSPDALGHDGSPSLYSFCQGNPIGYWDPDGRLGKAVATRVVSGVENTFQMMAEAQDTSDSQDAAAWAQLFGDQQGAQRLQDQADNSRASTQARADQAAADYQANYKYYGNSTALALNATLNPAVNAELSASEAYNGTGLHYQNSGETMDAQQRVNAAADFTVSAAQTVGAGLAIYGTGSLIGSQAPSLWAADTGIMASREGLVDVSQHLSTFGPDPANAAMYSRLTTAFENGQTLTGTDAAFYQHELTESSLMDAGMEARAAHLETLGRQGIEYAPGYESQLYHPTVIQNFPQYFNPAAHP
jgi:RHS repeat-associated protein